MNENNKTPKEKQNQQNNITLNETKQHERKQETSKQ